MKRLLVLGLVVSTWAADLAPTNRVSNELTLYVRGWATNVVPVVTDADYEAAPVSVRTAMDGYRKDHAVCEACAETPIQVHHVLPQAAYPELAADTNNFVSLCFKHHRDLGHPYGNTHKWNVNVKAIARLYRDGIRP